MSDNPEETEPSLPSHIAWAEALRYLPIFDQPGFDPGAWVEAEGTLPFFRYSSESAEFVEMLYSAGVIFNFDWPEWQGEAERLASDSEALAAADLSTLRKLLTTHVRKERFCEGHLASVLESGHITSVLRRIAALVDTDTGVQQPPKLGTSHARRDSDLEESTAKDELDAIVRDSLNEFVAWIFDNPWRGREREAVSLYVLGFLQKRCRPNCVLSDPTQIGIEVTVPGVKALTAKGGITNPKGRVSKDIVVWRKPAMTLWSKSWEDASGCPLAVMEWKVFRSIHRRPTLSARDLDWLASFTDEHSGSVGYAVSIDLEAREFRAEVARVVSGKPEEPWRV